MKTMNPQKPAQVKQCIAIGMNTKAQILEVMQCGSSSLGLLLRFMVDRGELELIKNGKVNVYKISRCDAFHDPFGLTKNRSPSREKLPQRRVSQCSNDQSRVWS